MHLRGTAPETQEKLEAALRQQEAELARSEAEAQGGLEPRTRAKGAVAKGGCNKFGQFRADSANSSRESGNHSGLTPPFTCQQPLGKHFAQMRPILHEFGGRFCLFPQFSDLHPRLLFMQGAYCIFNLLFFRRFYSTSIF